MSKNTNFKNIVGLSILVVVLMTLIVVVFQKFPNTYFIEFAEVCLTVLIICTIVIGLLIKRKQLGLSNKTLERIVVFLMVFGASFFGLYLYYVFMADVESNVTIDKLLSVFIGVCSLLLLIKIKYDLNTDSNDSVYD